MTHFLNARIAFFAAALLGCAGDLHAITRTWTGGGGGNWSLTSNWSPSGIPDPADDIVFNSGSISCNLSGHAQVRSITFTPGYAGNFNFSGYQLIVEVGDADMRTGGSFSMPAGSGMVMKGTATQLLHGPASGSLPAIVHDGIGTLRLSATLSTLEFLQIGGVLDLNGFDLATSGNFSIHNGNGSSVIGLAGRTLTVAGTTNLFGTQAAHLSLSPASGWTLASTGAVFSDFVTLGNCNASLSQGVAFRATDNGGNTNWSFANNGTFYWNRNNVLTTGHLHRTHNWTAGADGSGHRPGSGEDDEFTADALPSPWTFLDADPTAVGSSSLTARADQLEITGRGQGLDPSYNHFNGVFRSDITGDFDVTVKLLFQTPTLPQAQAGILIADDPASLSLGGYCALTFSPAGNLVFRRDEDGNGTLEAATTVSGLKGPIWLRMVRYGTSFLAWYRTSLAGGSWTQVGTTANLTSAGANSQVGLFSTAGTSTEDAFAVFDDFQAGTAFATSANNLSFNGTGAYADAQAVLGANTTVGSVDFTGYSGTFDFSSHTLEVSVGNATFVSAQTVTPGTGTLVFSAASGTQTFTPKPGATYPGISKSGAGTVVVAANPVAAPNLSIAAGTWDWGSSSLTHVLGAITASGGAMTFGSNTVQAAGNVDLSGLATLNANSGLLEFTNSATFTPKAGAIHPGIWKSVTGIVTLAGNALIANSLTVTAGTFNSSANSLDVTTTGNLSVTGATATLGMADGNATVGGDLTLSNGTLDCPGSSKTFNVAGSVSWTGGTLTHGSGTLTLNGTASGKSLDLSGGSLHNLAVNGTGGGWTLASALSLGGGLTVAAGTLTASAQALTVGSLTVNGGTLACGSGTLTVNGDFTLAGGSITMPSSDFNVAGNVSRTGGTASHNNGWLKLVGGTAGKTFDFSPILNNLNVSGTGGGWTTANNPITVLGLFQVQDGTFNLGASLSHSFGTINSTGGSLDFNSSTVDVSGNTVYLDGLATLTAGGGTLRFTDPSGIQTLHGKAGSANPHIVHNAAGTLRIGTANLSCLSFSQNAGTLDLNGFNLSTAGSGNFTVSGGNASSFANLGGRTITVAGDAILGGAASASRLNLDGGAAWYLNVSGTAAVSLATVQNANSGGYSAVACSHCANAGSNSNWNFAVAWDGGGGNANWTTAANWSSDAVPAADDDVTFDATGLGAMLDANATVKSLTMASGYTGSFDFGSSTLSITGNADFRSGGGIIANAGTLAFTGTGAQTFIPKSGATFPGIHQNGNAGTTTLTTNPLTAGNLTLGLGTFHLGAGMTHTVGAVLGGGGLDFGTSNLNVGGSVDLSAHTVTATSANTLGFVGAAAKTYTPNASEPDLVLAQTGSGTVTLAGAVTTPSLSMTAGRLNLGSYSHSAALVGFTGGILDFGSATLQTPAATVDLSALSAHIPGSGTLVFTGASPQTFTPTPGTGNMRLSLQGSGGVTFAADVQTLGLDIQAGTLDLGTGRLHTVTGGNITASGGGLAFSSSVLRAQGSVNLAGLSTLSAGTGILRFYTSGTPTLTPKASATHPHIEQVAASTLTLATNALTCLSFTQSAGTLNLGGQDLATVAAGNLTVTNGSSTSFSGLAGRTLTVAGNASFTGASAGSKVNLDPVSAWTLAVSGTLVATLASLANNTASASAGACTDCANAGSNSNWSFATGWDGGGADNNWTTAGNWGGDIVPSAAEAVTFGAASVKNATLDAAATVRSITFTSGYTGTFSFSSNTLTVDGGGADFRSGGTFDAGTGTLAFTGGGSQVFIPKGGATFPAILHNNNAGTTTVTTHPLTAGILTLGMGTFNLGASLTHTLAGIAGAGGLDFGTSNLNVTGNVDLGSQTLAATSASTLAFTGSSAQTFIPKASEPDLNLTQNGSGGTTVSTYDFTAPTLTIAQGTLNLGTGRTHSVASTLPVSGGGLDFGSSTLQVAAATVDFSSLAALVPGTGTLHFNGSSAQTFTPKASATHPHIRQYGSGGTTLATHNLTAGSLTLNQGTFHLGAGLVHAFTSVSDGGGGPYGSIDFGSSQLQVTSGNATFTNMPAVTIGTGSLRFTAATGIQWFSPKTGGGTHPAVQHTGAGTLRLGANLTCASFANSDGTLDLNGFDLATASSGDFTVTNGTASTFAGLGGRSLTVAGNASLSGTSGAARLNLDPGTGWSLAVTGSLSASLATVMNGTASGSPAACTNCANGGGNSGWTFATSWDGGGGDANWSTPANWGGDAVPTAGEDVTFGSTSANATLDAAASVKSITFTSGYSGTFSFSSNTLTVTGNADFRSGGNFTPGTGALLLTGTASHTFQPKSGASLPAITLNAAGGTYTVTGNPLTAAGLSVSAGTFHLGSSLTHDLGILGGTGTLDFGTSNVNATGNVDLSGLTVNASASNTLAFAGSGAQTFLPKSSLTALNLSKTGSGTTTVSTYDFTAPSLDLSAGTLELGAARTHLVTASLSISGGTLDFGSSALRVEAATVDLRNLAGLTPGTGSLQFTRTSAQTFIPHASLPLPALHQYGAGGTTTVTTNPLLGTNALSVFLGTFHLGSGLTHSVGSMGGTGGSGALDFGGSTLRITSGNASLNLVASVTAGTGTLEFTAASGTQVLSPLAGFGAPHIVHSGAGTLQLSGADLSCLSFTQGAGALDLNGRDLSATGNLTVTGGHPSAFVGLGGRTLTAGGDVSIAGSAGSIVNLDPATAWTLAATGTLTATYASVARANASAATGNAVNSADGGGNANWTFQVSWTGGATDDNWTSAANWGGNAVPGAGVNVRFDASGTKNAVLDAAATVKSIVFDPGYTGTFSFATNTLNVTGNADFRSGGAIAAGSGTLAFAGAAPQGFIPKSGGTFPGITQNGAGGTTISINPLAAGALNIMSGTFSLGSGFTHAVASVGGSGGGLDFGSSSLQAAGNVDLSGLSTLDAGTGLLELTGGGSQTLSPKAGATHPRVSKTGAGTATIGGAGLLTPGLRIAAGSLNLGSGLVHAATDTLLATGGTLDFGSSTLRTAAASPSFAGLAGLTAGTGALEFNGASAQTFTPKAGLSHPDLIQNGAGGTTVAGNGLQAGQISIALGTLNLGAGLSHTVGGFSSTGGGLDFGSSTAATTGGVDLGGLATLIAGTGTLSFTAATGTQVFVPRNGAVHPLLTHPSAGTVRLSGSSLLARGFDQTAGALDLNGFDLTLSATGSLAVSGSALPILGLSGRTLTVTGNARFTGTAAAKAGLDPASPWTLAVSGSLSAANARIRNSLATLAAGVADSSLDLGGNTGWTFLDTVKPDNVAGFLATATPDNGVALSWIASPSADADSVMLRYRTDGTYPTSRIDGTLWRRVKADRAADTATGLPDKTVYHFAAFVKDSSGNYSLATTASRDSARLPDVTPPANATALSASGLSSSAAALGWVPSASADADTVMIRYRTGLVPPGGPSDGTLWRKLPIAADKDTVSGLAPNTLYAFSLFVRDSSGNFSPAAASAQDTSLFQIPVAGTLAISDVSGLTADGDPALAFTWSGADSLRFSLLADTAAAAWKPALALDSLSLGAADGQKVVAVQFKNVFGRASPWYRDTTLVDRQAPTVTLDLEADLGRWTWPVAVSGTSKDSLAGTDRVFVVRRRLQDGYHFNGTAWQAAADTAKLALSGSDTLFSASLPASAMATGDYQFTAYARDRAGNTGLPVTRAVHYEANRVPALAYGNVKDTVLQNQAVSWKLDFGDLDAGDSLSPISFETPAWLTAAPGADTAWTPWAVHRTWTLAGKPGQAHVGNNVIQVRLQDRGGLILTFTDTVRVVDVNDAPVFADSQGTYAAKEDSVSRWTPAFEDADPDDRHTLALLSAPAFAKVESLSVVLRPGSRDVGEYDLALVVGDGALQDTLHTVLTVVNVNDPPYAFASTGFRSPAYFREDLPDSFSVVVVDLDRNEPIVFAGQKPAWMQVSMAVDSTGMNRTFTFRVRPTQGDTGRIDMALAFVDPSQAVAQIRLAGRILPDNDTPTAVVEDPRTQGGAARFRLSVTDEDGSLEKARFHYRLVGPSGDTVRRGITPSSLLALHPLADGEYRLAVRAEDQDGVQQGAFTVVPFTIAGATTLSLDTARWHMLGPQQALLPAAAFGAGATLATWDEAGDDGQPLARYASGKTVEALKRGKGYWVRLAMPATLATAQKDLAEGPTPLRLTRAKQGWNQVANPYPYWVDVSASKLTFWEWDAERRDLVNARGLLKPWAAYWVLAPRDTTLIIADAPWFPATQGALAKAAAASFRHRGDWSLQVGLRAGRYHDQGNLLGVKASPSGPPGDGPSALADAPKFGDYIALHFEKPDSDGRPEAAQGYAYDIRDALHPEEEWWDFSVENRGTGEARAHLSPSGLEPLAAAGLKVFLVKRGEARLVEPGQEAVLDVGEERTHYSLVVTPHADFAGRLKGNFSISQNFPNPVTAFTTFRFVLPHAWDREGKRVARNFKLRIKVYDYSGREVARAVDGSFRPGAHALRWTPVTASGSPLAKGAYLYRLETAGFTRSMKMVVE